MTLRRQRALEQNGRVLPAYETGKPTDDRSEIRTTSVCGRISVGSRFAADLPTNVALENVYVHDTCADATEMREDAARAVGHGRRGNRVSLHSVLLAPTSTSSAGRY